MGVSEQERVKSLPGQPNPESVDITVTFQSSGKDALGMRVLELPLALDDGPCYTVQLRVNVTIPELQLSQNSLDFGELLLGQCKTMTVQLHNPKVRE